MSLSDTLRISTTSHRTVLKAAAEASQARAVEHGDLVLHRTAIESADPALSDADRIPAIVRATGAPEIAALAAPLVKAIGAGKLPDQMMYFGPPSLAMWCALAPEWMIERLTAFFEAHNVNPGMPLADRPAALAKIDARLAALEAEDEAAHDEAAALGIALPMIPAVAQRRQAERQRQARQAEAHELAHRANSAAHRRLHEAEQERERAREAAARLERLNREQAEREAAARGQAAGAES